MPKKIAIPKRKGVQPSMDVPPDSTNERMVWLGNWRNRRREACGQGLWPSVFRAEIFRDPEGIHLNSGQDAWEGIKQGSGFEGCKGN